MGMIDSNFSKFDDRFFDGQSQHYLDFATPQINEQYSNAQDGLGYALARQGLGASSEGSRRIAKLSGDFQLNRQGAVDKSRNVANQARQSIESARSGLIQNLYATADPIAANKNSLSQAKYLSAPQAPDQIGQLFASSLDGLNTYQSAKNDAQAYRGALSSAGVSGLPTGSGRNIG